MDEKGEVKRAGRNIRFHCTACDGYFLETHGTLFHGKQAAVELIVRVLACLAEGLGIRGTARVFEIVPNTVLGWLVEAAEQRRAFAASCLCDLHLEQLPLDEVSAGLRALKAGESKDDEAITRLERSPSWVWTAMAPQSKLVVVVDVGHRTRAMAQCVGHQVTEGLARDCVPLFVTAGLQDYATALLTHGGQWRHPARRHDTGPRPKPRGMPLPQLLYVQVVEQYRRKRVVGGRPQVGFGTREAVKHILAACGWTIKTSVVERLNLAMRQRVAAVGRRVHTLCQSADGLQHQLVLVQAYHNFVLPHAS